MRDHDETFDEALRYLDIASLTAECQRRLDACSEGTRILFRIGKGYPPAWGGVASGKGAERHAEQAAEAACMLIEYARGTRYKIVRHYRDRYPNRRTLQRGLSLYEAQQHCSNPETSSSTCKSAAGRARTRRLGAWFDGYTTD